MEIERLLASYPRRRPPLSNAHKEIYEDEYKLNRSGRTFFSRLSQKTEGWMHRKIIRSVRGGKILEIGAGTLNHVPYESAAGITAYDIVEPFERLYADSPYRRRVRAIYKNITDIRDNELYERIISIAVLEHLTDLPFVVAYSALMLADNGLFQHGIPSEGGLAWELGWRLTTGLSFRHRTGLSYSMLMRYEHVNAAPEILAIIRYFFDSMRVLRFPFPTHHLSLYTYIEAAAPHRERCRRFLAGWTGKRNGLTC